jgi:hypothetical protein
MAFACKILADSISPAGHRITSFEATFPRIVLAEVNTHCALARCSASSRAIPVEDKVAAILRDPFVPEAFKRNRGGMQPGEALEGEADVLARASWHRGMSYAIGEAHTQDEIGVHKQYANRLIEPFSWHTAVITATDWDNFFHLRVNPLAQGEFQTIAKMMLDARDANEPRALNYGDWHLPYVEAAEAFSLEVEGFDPVKVSVARCARVSRERQNDIRSPADEMKMFDERLLAAGHMSPLEHAARPMTPSELELTRTWDVAFDDGPVLRIRVFHGSEDPKVGHRWDGNGWGGMITYVRGPLHYAAKYNGWVSRRQFVHGEHDIHSHRARTA